MTTTSIPRPDPVRGNMEWFLEARFGLFIHWGLYACAARHEWVQSREEIDGETYAGYLDRFDPDRFDPADWARRAKAAGMRYVVITAKHHEGFCLWDTQHTEYKATNTPAGRDLLREALDAFRAEGLRVGCYYSLLDWHHPDFPIDIHHPLRNHPEAAAMNEGRDVRRYAEYMRRQVRELLAGYGPLDILWFDFSYPDREYKGLPGKGREDWESEKLLALVREWQPEIILNNRLDLPGSADLFTPEQKTPRAWVRHEGRPVYWEACQTLSGSWGYHRDEASWKSPGQLVRMLVEMVSKGGNLLMNVGPTARGDVDPRARAALKVYADWMALHGRSVYGCTQSPYAPPADGRLTQHGNRLYIHVFAWPFKHLYLDGLAGRVAWAQLLHDGSEVPCETAGDGADGSVRFTLPVQRPDVPVPVIEVALQEPAG